MLNEIKNVNMLKNLLKRKNDDHKSTSFGRREDPQARIRLSGEESNNGSELYGPERLCGSGDRTIQGTTSGHLGNNQDGLVMAKSKILDMINEISEIYFLISKRKMFPAGFKLAQLQLDLLDIAQKLPDEEEINLEG